MHGSIISTKRGTEIRLNTILVLLVLNFVVFIVNTKLFININMVPAFAFIFVNMALMFLLLRTEYFEYDSSGEVISLRSVHPIFRHTEKRTEFPKNMLYNFWISRNYLGTAYLKIAVRTPNEKKVTINYKIHCCSNAKLRKISASFVELKELNIR